MSNEEAREESKRLEGEIRDALTSPDVSLKFVQTFTHGRGVQVHLKARKIGPILLPGPDQTTGDVLLMLGEMLKEADPAPTSEQESEPKDDLTKLAQVLYEWQATKNREDGDASYPAPAWREIPAGSQHYWREQAARVSDALSK